MKIRNKQLQVILLASVILVILSCKKDKSFNRNNQVARTVLIYMAANNNLAYDALNSFKKIKNGVASINGNLLVLLKTESARSYLLKVDPKERIDTLKTYNAQNTSDPIFLSQVISDSKFLYPAKSFGFVFWSHATSWAPPSNLEIKVKSIGYDFGKEMDIKDFRNALPDNLEFILFDACSMASLEAAYELKDKAKFILASPSEVLSASYPYQKIIPLLFGGVEDLKKVGQEFINYYKSLQGELSSATISLINTQELPKLAELTKNLLNSQKPNIGFNRSELQRLNFDVNTQNPNAYDFLDFISQNYSQEHYISIKQQLEKVILYKDHTSTFLGSPIKTFSGVSIYLPIADDPAKEYYRTLSWSKASNWISLFF